jgi:hypothetical protein
MRGEKLREARLHEQPLADSHFRRISHRTLRSRQPLFSGSLILNHVDRSNEMEILSQGGKRKQQQ